METCTCGDPATEELSGRPCCRECWDELANGVFAPPTRTKRTRRGRTTDVFEEVARYENPNSDAADTRITDNVVEENPRYEESNNDDVYVWITEKIIAQLEKGVAIWRRPWATIGGGLPANVVSRQAYRGINTMLLWVTTEEQGYESNLWGTYRQWDMLGGHVKRGECGTKVIFRTANTQTVLSDFAMEEKKAKCLFYREFTVFNLDQCGGTALDRFRSVRLATKLIDFGPTETAIKATRANIRHGGARAYFDRSSDYIQLPIRTAFASTADYYLTALHELVHWTGHESRLNRIDKLSRFGDRSYAVEEMVAELGSAFLAAMLGFPVDRTLDSAAAYLACWLKVLKSDNQAIFTVVTAASAAAEHVLSFSRTVETEEADSERNDGQHQKALDPQPDQPAVPAQPLSTSDATPSIAAAVAEGATAA